MCVHLCPLDCASNLPAVDFENFRIERLSPDALNDLVKVQHITANYPEWIFESERFSRFTWLIVKDDTRLDDGQCTSVAESTFLNFSDPGKIEPHRRKFPEEVEEALFWLLLQPWEQMVLDCEIEWRAFFVPWCYTVDDKDSSYAYSHPPSANSLSWQPDIILTQDGNEIEIERPIEIPLVQSRLNLGMWLNEPTLMSVKRALRSPLFAGPIATFLLRAFMANGIDEFMAHVTVIEACLGQESDYLRRSHSKSDKQKSLQGKYCVARRLTKLLGAKCFGEQFLRLFEIRSVYSHGRKINSISGAERLLARQLARETVCALVLAAGQEPSERSRSDFLNHLIE